MGLEAGGGNERGDTPGRDRFLCKGMERKRTDYMGDTSRLELLETRFSYKEG